MVGWSTSDGKWFGTSTFNPVLTTLGIPAFDARNTDNPRCDTIGKVHHFHKQRIECLDTKTINEEDLPFIFKCCKCDLEEEIPMQPPLMSINSPKKRLRPTATPAARFEREQADAVMKAYNEKRQKRIQVEALKFASK